MRPRSLLLLLLLVPVRVAVAAPPHSSWSSLSFSNGFGAGIYDVATSRVTTLRDHLYAQRSSGESTVNLCYDAYFGLRADGQNAWLGEKPASAAYVPGTGVVKVTQTHGALTAEQYFFAPFGLGQPALVMLIKVTASAAMNDSAVFSIHNFHLGSGASGTDAERIDWDAATQTFVERGTTTGRVLLARSLGDANKHGASPQNPYGLVKAGGALVNVTSSGVVNDAVSGFQHDLSLGPGDSTWYGVALVAGSDETALTAALDGYLKGRGPQQLLDDELKDWSVWQQQGTPPSGLSTDEAVVYRQALAILRMAQVREPNVPGGASPYGQLVASLPPGKWNIAWVRDGAYAILALARAGHLTEARDGLLFMLRGKAGSYVCCDKSGGPYVGVPYLISVTRYFGDGTEESDSNADGPNIEFDDFGLFLWAASEVAARLPTAEASAFLGDWYAKMASGVADVLLSLVEPSTGLLRADSSIWERHWENGKRRHHTYSSVMAVAGLQGAAAMAKLLGKSADEAKYGDAATKLAAAIRSKLVDGTSQVLASDLESLALGPTSYMDAASVEAFLLPAIYAASDPVAGATLAAYDKYLRTAAGPGYKRNDDGDSYDEREWLVVDLRIATLLNRRGDAKGQALLDWVTSQARLNHDLIPELLDQSSADYAGEVPMAGFGAGAYILALHDRGGAKPADSGPGPRDARVEGGRADAGPREAGAADARTDAGGTKPSEGCGCATASGAASELPGLLLALAALALVRRRRR